MLVIVSDIHLTDHTTGMCIPASAFRLFQDRLEDMAFEASKRRVGEKESYRPVEGIDLVLLGDIFDPLRSTHWTDEPEGHAGFARPWSNPNDPAFIQKVDAITSEIIHKNAESLSLLQSMAAGEAISLPAAMQTSQFDRRLSDLSRSRKRVPVKVNIHYVVGNHDWYYHLPGEPFALIRQKIILAMGLCDTPTIFPYEPPESPQLEDVFRQHRVFARHGDYYDPYNYDPRYGRNHATLGDALVVELFNRIRVYIQSEIRDGLPEEFYRDLDEIGNIRPDIMVPVWIGSLLNRYQASKSQRYTINALWHDLVAQFLQVDFLDQLNRAFKRDVVDDIRRTFQVLKIASMESLQEWAPAAERLWNLYRSIRSSDDLYEQAAAGEEAYQSQRARFIVYGHTHHYRVYPLRSVQINRLTYDQLYLNCGTWRPLHEICRAEAQASGFIAHKAMSFLSFYKNDERKSRSFETWNGALDL